MIDKTPVYLERSAVDRALTSMACADSKKNSRVWAKALSILYEVPPADVEKIRRGAPEPHYETWLNSDGDPVQTVRLGMECPFCGDTGIKKYCPECGAKMEGAK